MAEVDFDCRLFDFKLHFVFIILFVCETQMPEVRVNQWALSFLHVGPGDGLSVVQSRGRQPPLLSYLTDQAIGS